MNGDYLDEASVLAKLTPEVRAADPDIRIKGGVVTLEFNDDDRAAAATLIRIADDYRVLTDLGAGYEGGWGGTIRGVRVRVLLLAVRLGRAA